MTGLLLLSSETAEAPPFVPGNNDVVLVPGATNPYDIRIGGCCDEHQEPTPVAPTTAPDLGSWTTRRNVKIELAATVLVDIEMTAEAIVTINVTARALS